MTYKGWIPKLTPAKLRALAHVANAPHVRDGIECRGVTITACHALEQMGLVVLSTGKYGWYSITPAGRKALINPASFKPFRV
jgi:hypothetical protein